MAEGMSLIFTNNSAWGGPDGRERFAAFAADVRQAAKSGGGRVQFIRLTAPLAVLEERLANPERQELGKLLDVARLRELLVSLDDSALHEDDLTIDTSQHSPDEAAFAIKVYLARVTIAR
jgi:hypothetical protein